LSGLVHEFGELHPALVHFPIALVVAAAVSELLYVVRRREWFGEAARFTTAAGAWMAVPSVAAGFSEAWGRTFAGEAGWVFSVHWVCGVASAGLAFLAYGLGEASRRSGQVWEQALYRAFLLLAAVAVLLTGYFGGRLDAATGERVSNMVDFGLTMIGRFWY
jgi:uncharacterized membrane protein